MPSLEGEAQAARQQLERVLESAGFSRNERLSRFLRFVVERHLDSKDHELKESVIAIEVFGRRPDFDSRLDPVVRTEAARLRARLNEYYIKEGQGDALVIELPKGGYVPRFRTVEQPQVVTPIAEYTRARFRARFWVSLGLAGLVIGLGVAGWWWIQQRSAPIAIAVLPLENTGHAPANDYFAAGLTDELIRNLSIIDRLAVRSRTSSFGMKGKPRSIREAGEQLQADYILEGSVLRSGPQFRINVQLVRVRDDFPLWSGTYEAELTDIFAMQEEISRGIVNNLRLKLGQGRRRYETSIEAYDLYLHARALPNQRSREPALKAAGLYQQVIAKDPSFAPAYAGLAAAYAAISSQGFRDHDDELMQMRTAAEKAILMDPLLSEAHQALGNVYSRDGQWAHSEESFRRAIALEPSNSLAYSDLTLVVLLPLGRIDEGVHEMQIAEKADPLSPWVQSSLAWALLSAGRYQEAAKHCEQAAETRCLGRARLEQGKIEEAMKLFAKEANPYPQYLGYAYGLAGRREEAERFAAAAAPNAFTQALTFAGLGDKDRTLEALDRMASLGAVRVGRALNSPEFAFLRGDLRVKALRKKVGLPE
ncbi:MAG: repeat-containing protein [Candidatus Solibacter sp.]|nr:repeat-containing protein [Candidatus Solibacter sp.]